MQETGSVTDGGPSAVLSIFRRVREHLLAQGRRAVSPTGYGCRYRVLDGDTVLRCAVGCLIPEEAYDPAVEGVGVLTLRPVSTAAGPRWDADSLPCKSARLGQVLDAAGIPATPEVQELLDLLQKVHDVSPPAAWAERLEEIEARLVGTLDGREVGP